jgi:hypothetical protein
MNSPIWMPPLSGKTIFTVIFVIAATQADKLPEQFNTFLLHPIGFILSILIAISAFEYGAPSFAVALILLLLSVWSFKKVKSKNAIYNKPYAENFTTYIPSGTIDWVFEPKKWFVEKVMKETPLGIVAKDVHTYPVQTESSSSNA